MPTENKATTADAQLILQFYDLRREAEMRKARNFIGSFSPKSFEDVMKVVGAFGNQENAWFRQVYSYWEMAASLVLRGAVNDTLFNDNSGEMYFHKCIYIADSSASVPHDEPGSRTPFKYCSNP